ncbi:MAG: hypothetical protein ACKOCN_05725 [Planctomycetaceae bacterium]
MPIEASNVLLVCTACGKPTRLGVRIAEDGSRSRRCRLCDAELGVLRPAASGASRGKSAKRSRA